MSKKSLKITYGVILKGGYTISEEDLLNDKNRANISQESDLYGYINIESDGNRIIVKDNLIPWIQNLCLEPISILIGGDNVKISYFSSAGDLFIENDLHRIKVKDRDGSSLEADFKPFVNALMECGVRFIDKMSIIKKEDNIFMNNIVHLNIYKARAEGVLDILDFM